jgi:hypothetical protein
VPWKPSEPGEVPTLGYVVIDWITAYLAAPDRIEYEPFLPYLEQEDFLLRFYELDPRTGKRRRRRGVISRPRGWGKSPLLAAMMAVEALGPVVPDGWDADGQPVGKPWSLVRTPIVQVAAVSEKQTRNTWDPLLEMLREGPVLDEYDIEPLDTFVNLPKGRIEPITSAASTTKGGKPVFAALDQTEEWVKSNGGLNLFQKIKNNTAKIGGSFVESPNAFIPGLESVAEHSAAFWESIQSGKARDDGLHYDHREAPETTSLVDRDSLVLGLRIAYGDSSAHPDGCVLHDPPCPPGHSDLDHLVATIWDPTSDVQESRSDFLNQVTHASDSWLTKPQVGACRDLAKWVEPGEMITLGFDGSLKRSEAVTDATALVGCRVSDGHLFEVRVWEQPAGPEGRDWMVPEIEVDAEVHQTFKDYNVVGFFGDPAKWATWLVSWEAKYHDRLKVKATRDNPIHWWMTGGSATQIVRATDELHTAIVKRQCTHDGSSALTRHLVNARRRMSRAGMQIAKAHPESDKKIDAAVAAILAWQARLAAIAAGLAEPLEEAGSYSF